MIPDLTEDSGVVQIGFRVFGMNGFPLLNILKKQDLTNVPL